MFAQPLSAEYILYINYNTIRNQILFLEELTEEDMESHNEETLEFQIIYLAVTLVLQSLLLFVVIYQIYSVHKW